MKKIKLNTILIMLLTFSACAYAIDEAQLQEEIKKCNLDTASKCYQKLLFKSNSNIVRLYYAEALLREKQITNAKIILQNILKSENPNSPVYAAAKTFMEQINTLSSEMKTANNADQGDYFNEITDVRRWEYPNSIKVYIKGNTGKEHILKNAFEIWDKSQNKVNFVTVYSESRADIVCEYVNWIDSEKAGITYSLGYKKGSETYIKNAKIQISMHKSNMQKTMGGNYTDSELLSITLHEVGHAIGIISHSDNINDIMYYSTASYRNSTLSNRDINTVRKLYK